MLIVLYKILIADDEKLIRDNLSTKLDWNKIGFEVASVLEDGSEVLKYIEYHDIDVIFTDIKMSLVSGIDIAKYVYENKLPIKIVLMSGYRDFEYARQAIEYGVAHYITKPTRVNEIEKIFTEIKEQLDISNNSNNVIDNPLVQQFFINILLGAVHKPDEILKSLMITNLDINPYKSQCCIINIVIKDYYEYLDSKWNYGKDALHNALMKFICCKSTNISYYLFYHVKNRYYTIAFTNSTIEIDEFNNQLNLYISSVKNNIKDLLDLNLDFSGHQIYSNIFEMAESDISDIIIQNNSQYIKQTNTADNQFALEQQKLIVSSLNSGDYEAVFNIFDSIFSKLRTSNIALIKKSMESFCNYIFDGTEYIVDIAEKPDYTKLNTLITSDEIYSFVKLMLNKLIEAINANQSTPKKLLISKITEYINEHYCEDISLDDIGNYIYLNPAYLSRFFKQHFSENYIDYLIRLRMEKAKVMLKNPNCKVYTICNSVGYKSVKYFNRLFKNYTGLTPTEYRNSIIEE